MDKRILVIGFLVGFISMTAQGQGLTERIYACYIGDDMVEWVKVMDQMKQVYMETGSVDMLREITMAQYGYIAICVARDEEEDGKSELLCAERNVKLLLEYNADWAEIHALKGALYAFKVGFDPYKFVVYGRSAKQANALAMKLAPESPAVWMEKGNLEMYWPDFQRDDAKYASEAYKKALSLYEEDVAQIDKNWLYLNTMVSLATAYRKAELYAEADAMYQKILRIEPNIVWIRDRDYPKFKKKYSSSLRSSSEAPVGAVQ